MSIRQRYRLLLKRALATSPFRKRPVYRIGKYYADYSERTPEDLKPIPEMEELFRNSTPVNRRVTRS